MLALEDDAFAVFAAIGHAVGDHPQIFVPAGADDRDDLRKAAFAVKRHIFVGASATVFFSSSSSHAATPSRHVEWKATGLSVAETHPLALKLQKQLFVLRHGGGRAGLRKADAERVEYIQYFQLVLDGIGDRGSLCAPSRSVVSSTPMLFFNALQPSFTERGVCAANASLHCLIYLSYKSMICWIS